MNRITKRIMALMICLTMVLVLIPANIYASDDADYAEKSKILYYEYKYYEFGYKELEDGTVEIISCEGPFYSKEHPYNESEIIKIEFPQESEGKKVSVLGDGRFPLWDNLVVNDVVAITIPKGVITINDFAFEDFSGIKKITIPNTVTVIGKASFKNCGLLKKVTIPSSVKKIKENAFSWDVNLGKVIVPDSVEYIGKNAFEACLSIKLCGNKKSAIEKYAKKYKIPFTVTKKHNK